MSDSDKSSFPVSVSSCPKSSNSEGGGWAYWQSHIEDWSASDLSQSEYCRRHNLNYNRFQKWKHRLKNYPRGRSVKLVEVKRDFIFDGPGGPGASTDTFVGRGGLGEGADFSLGFPSGVGGTRLAGVGRVRSGIRFWLGEFCIEVDVPFSSPCLSQLIGTLREFGEFSSQTAKEGELENGSAVRGGGGGGGGGGGSQSV